MKLFTLLHINEREKSLHNDSVKSFDEQIELYLQCAIRLHKSLQKNGMELTILTNKAEYLLRLLKGAKIEVVELNFSLEVPSGISYYSAHFKIEVYNYLASLKEHYVGLIDNDIICLNETPEHLKNIIKLGLPLYYDVTDQVIPSEGLEKVMKDKQKICKNNVIGMWAGGEFIAGPPSFFTDLYNQVQEIKKNYFKNYNSLFHKSDESLSATAIERMRINGYRMFDGGALNIIGRFWSPKTRHVQKSFDAYVNHFLIHLPSDKKFIASLSDGDLEKENFILKYKKYLQKRSVHQLASKIKGALLPN